MKAIALQLTRVDAETAGSIEIDGDRVAAGLDLPVDTFRQLMKDRKISVLCERGIDEDAGLYRARFYYGPQRFRTVVNARGEIMESAG